MAKAAAREKTPMMRSIEGLPSGAVVEGTRVFFVYRRKAALTETFQPDYFDQCFKSEWREERDEIGVVADGRFQPNDYFQNWKPAADRRPVHRWQSPFMRQAGYRQRYADWNDVVPKVSACARADYEFQDGQLAEKLLIGFSGYAADQLWTNGIAEALVCGAFEGDADAAADFMNLILGFWPMAAATALPATTREIIEDACRRSRLIGRAPLATDIRPVLKRLGAKPGFLQRFNAARRDAAEARDAMVILDGRHGLAWRTAIDEPEILAVHAFQKPERWSKPFFESLLEALGAREDPVYCLRGTLDAADLDELADLPQALLAEVEWANPAVEAGKEAFWHPLQPTVQALGGRTTSCVMTPDVVPNSLWQYALINCELRGYEEAVRQSQSVEDYLDEIKNHPKQPCPASIKPWLDRGKNGRLEQNPATFFEVINDRRWEAAAVPARLGSGPKANKAVLRLWQAAEGWRHPIADMATCLEKAVGRPFSDEVTPEKEAALTVAALAAALIAKFNRQCRTLDAVENQHRYGDEIECWSHDGVRDVLTALSSATLQWPVDSNSALAQLLVDLDSDLVLTGYALGMSCDHFDSVTGLFDKLSPTFLKDVARRFADPRKPLPPAPAIQDPAAYTDPVQPERLEEFLEWIAHSRGKNALCTLFAELADVVKARWGAAEKTMAARLVKQGFPDEAAQAMARRLALALTVAQRLAAKRTGAPLSTETLAERERFMEIYVQAKGSNGLCESIQIFLSALAGAVEAIPPAQAKEEAKRLARLAHEVAGR